MIYWSFCCKCSLATLIEIICGTAHVHCRNSNGMKLTRIMLRYRTRKDVLKEKERWKRFKVSIEADSISLQHFATLSMILEKVPLDVYSWYK